MLSIEEVARHYGLRPDTVRRKVRNGEIEALRIGRLYRLDWQGVWACEEGPMPKGARQGRYMEPLLSKRRVAGGLGVSARTIERWIALGLPTRNVFGATRCNPHDVEDWLKITMNLKLPADWWK
jgi:excisionase family DNA binding protein